MKKVFQQPATQIELDDRELEQITGGRRHLPPPPPHKRRPAPAPAQQPGVPAPQQGGFGGQPGVPGGH